MVSTDGIYILVTYPTFSACKETIDANEKMMTMNLFRSSSHHPEPIYADCVHQLNGEGLPTAKCDIIGSIAKQWF